MISKDQYRQAKELIEAYELQLSQEAILNLQCISCNKAMQPLEGYLPALDKLQSGAWEDGTVALVSFGYGSRLHDNDSYYVALCDQCMQDRIKQGIVIHYHSLSSQRR